MKKIRFIIPMLLTLLVITGCSKKEENNKTNVPEDTANLSPIPTSNEELDNIADIKDDTSKEDNSSDGDDLSGGDDSSKGEDSSDGDDSSEKSVEYETDEKDMIVKDEPFGIAFNYNDIDYGSLEKVSYYSTTAQRDTYVNILLPAGYSENEKYPVLYVLHGYWGNEDSMVDAGDPSLKIQQIVGNLVSKGEAKKMIIVFPYIYTSKDQPIVTAMDLENSLNYDNFINDLVTDLMPFVENNYAAATGRDNTAITGFSMGGRESLFIGFTRTDLFGYIGAVCPAPGLTPGYDIYSHPGQLQEDDLIIKNENETPFLIMISAALYDNVVGDQPEKYHDILTKNNVDHIWNLITGGDHGGKGIRPHIYNFARVIFKAD